jgi:hypothetical protein
MSLGLAPTGFAATLHTVLANAKRAAARAMILHRVEIESAAGSDRMRTLLYSQAL